MPPIADAVRITGLECLAEQCGIRLADLLEYHGVGVGLGEKFRHLVHVVVVVPKIEGDEAQEARTARRGVDGSARQRGDDQRDIDAGENDCGQHETPMAHRNRQAEKGNGAGGYERQAVIDQVERWQPARQRAKQSQARAPDNVCDDQSLQPSSHTQIPGFSRADGREGGRAPI